MDVSLQLDAESVYVDKRRVRESRKILVQAAKANQRFCAIHAQSRTSWCSKRGAGDAMQRSIRVFVPATKKVGERDKIPAVYKGGESFSDPPTIRQLNTKTAPELGFFMRI